MSSPDDNVLDVWYETVFLPKSEAQFPIAPHLYRMDIAVPEIDGVPSGREAFTLTWNYLARNTKGKYSVSTAQCSEPYDTISVSWWQ